MTNENIWFIKSLKDNVRDQDGHNTYAIHSKSKGVALQREERKGEFRTMEKAEIKNLPLLFGTKITDVSLTPFCH